jgi:hypothetical protein
MLASVVYLVCHEDGVMAWLWLTAGSAEVL